MLPNNVGMAAGLTIGFSVGMGGFGVTILGFLADNYGLPFVMNLMTVLPVIATLTAFKIPVPPQSLPFVMNLMTVLPVIATLTAFKIPVPPQMQK